MTLAMILETGVRSTLLIAAAGLGLTLLRVRSSALKLAVWRLVLLGCLLMPLASVPWRLAPRVTVTPEQLANAPVPVRRAAERVQALTQPRPADTRPDLSGIFIRVYWLAGGLLFLRALTGLLRVRQLSLTSNAVPELGSNVLESPNVRVPVTCGLVEGRILLPAGWREWSSETLRAVLAHEGSHVNQRDFLTQILSRMNCAIQWANPLVWWLQSRIVALAEEVGDDAALASVAERPSYAALLLGFAGKGERLAYGVAMARNLPVERRIDRILEESRPLSRPLGAGSQAVLAVGILAAAFLIGACRVTTVSAQTKPGGAAPGVSGGITGGVPGGARGGVRGGVRSGSMYTWNNSDQSGWALIDPGQGSSMSGTGPMGRALMAARTSHGPVIWFAQSGTDYLIEDPATLDQVKEWLAPQQELGRRQGELGQRQGALGEQMGKLGEEMGRLGEQMGSVKVDMPKLSEQLRKLEAEAVRLEKSQATMDALGDLQSKIGELQSRIGEVQGLAGERQSKIGEMQSKLGEQQSKLGEQQSRLGEEQSRLGDQQARLGAEVEEKMHKLFDEAIKDGRAKPVK